MLSRRSFLYTAAAIPAISRAAVWPPRPYGAVPSRRQMLWQERDVYAFLHFTINTFTDKEWGYGDESPALFNPTAFDAEAIVRALMAGGMSGVILTCKHHDGFCLWPTKTTEHCVRNSPWRQGRGDVVRELSDAARRNGMQFGVYLSPWDRNTALYGRPEYIQMYREQLRELLTGYGQIFEVWHDGANGGDGFYGGAREKRSIDRRSYYDWPKTWDMVRSLQPDAVIFSDVGPDVRWVGNESGVANETCWATFDPVGEDGGPAAPGWVRAKESGTGHRNGKQWMPAECDVSIRPGWFWHEKENAKVKTPRQLLDLYFQSVGRGTSFLLNVPPDRRGLLHEADVASLAAFGELRHETFRTNLAAQARITASNVRGGGAPYDADNLVDGDRNTFWSTDDGVRTPQVVFAFPESIQFDIVRARENTRLGQRVEALGVDTWQDGQWVEAAKATSIGMTRLIRLPAPVKTRNVRLRITQSPVCPALSEFGLFASPQAYARF